MPPVKSLINDINVLDLKCKENPNDDNLRSKLKEKEQILEHIYDERARGIYVRSKAQSVEDGEKSSKFFFSLKKIARRKKLLAHSVENETFCSKMNLVLGIFGAYFCHM